MVCVCVGRGGVGSMGNIDYRFAFWTCIIRLLPLSWACI